jgi:hypothetical protein
MLKEMTLKWLQFECGMSIFCLIHGLDNAILSNCTTPHARITSIRPAFFVIISHGNATHKSEVIESNSYTSPPKVPP